MSSIRAMSTRLGLTRLLIVVFIIATLAPVLAVGVPAVLRAGAIDPCGTGGNPITCENSKPGDPPSNWQITGVGDTSIQGFATSMGVNLGQTESFKVQTTASSWYINILRLGYYGGDGARLIATDIQPSVAQPQTQPPCLSQASTGLVDCGNWAVSASWTVPTTAVSGVYIAELVRTDTGGMSQIPFVVRDDASHSDMIYQTSDETWEAYNTWGGNSLYQCAGAKPPAPFASDTNPVCPPGNPQGYQGAFAVSYNRPWNTATTDGGESWWTNAEFPMIEFLEQQGYDVTYTDEANEDANGSLLLNHKVFISSGHDEYWSAGQRAAVTNARDHGVSLAFFSGNEIFWKTRWANSTDASNTPYRTLVTYKETHFNAPTDPDDPPTWTGSWEDPRFSPPADGDNPGNALTGQFFAVNYGTTDIQVPAAYAPEMLWRNTAVAKLAAGQSVTLGPAVNASSQVGTLGYEWDIDADNGFRPPGEIDLSSTTLNANSGDQVFNDYGTNVVPATVTHHLTLYKAASGAYVFGAGTVQFAYGLASSNPAGAAPDPNMEQFVVNLFGLMGVEPATLTAGLALGSPSTATGPPTSTITSPAPGATLTDGAPVTITGTATDNNGGVVAGVEVSTDGGKTWHPATTFTPGTSTTWTYNWTGAHGSPTTTIESRATDDSGNIETPSDAETVDINCPCSIWGSGFSPTTTDSGDGTSVEVGVKFYSDVYGTINGIRFYKSTANTGTHIGNLWTSSGQLLASATFTGETASGWQYVAFSKPVPILPGTTYVASYFAPNGHTADDDYYLYENPQPATMGPTTADSPPLHAIRSTATNGGNGVFTDSNTSTFPDNADTGTNYWVDVSFSPQPAPGSASNVTATAGYSSAQLAWSAPTTGGPTTSYTITPYVGGVAQATTTVSGSPAPTTASVPGLTNGTSYTFTVTATNPAGSAAPSAQSNAVTPSTTAPPEFVQQAGTQASSVKSISIQPSQPVTAGNRLVVEVASWANASPKVTAVTDSAGDTFTELSSTTGPDGTVLTTWTAVVTYSGGTQPTITATGSASADMGIVALEYAGLSEANGSTVLDSSVSASGTTGSSAATISSGATGAASDTNDLALGFYADSGFSDALSAGSGWTARSSVSPESTIELFGEDQLIKSGATATATMGTGKNTPWALTALLLKPASATPPTAPSAPSAPTATAGSGSATVSWSAPSNGGSLITSYTVTPYAGSTAGTPVTVTNQSPTESTTITGLTSGTSYTFTVTATNSVGTSPASAPSNAVTPQAQSSPAAPTGVSAAAGTSSGSATVSWTAPSNGGSPITSYTVTPYTTGETSTALPSVTVTGSPPATTASVTGLTNGSSYLFSVTATNAIGTGPASTDSNQITAAGPPLAPTGVGATPGAASANVSWTAPDPQGSPITSYTVTPFVGSTPQVPVTVSGSPPATSALMAGLTDGTTYTFEVTATNAAGTSVASAPSAPVTPAAAPQPPSPVIAATAGSGSLSVSWTPGSNSGNAISSYTVTPYKGSTPGTPVTVSGSPPATSTTISGLTNGTTYTFQVTATNAMGTSASSAQSNPATPVSAPEVCPCTIFGSQTPGTVDSEDGSSVNVGTAFTTDTNGYITGMRFYKAAANTGTHVGSLWTSSGTLLAQATFSNETASGWQQVSFPTSVAVTAGTTYVVSYYAPNGHYSQDVSGLATAADGPPLYALASANAPNGNGVFTYASTTAFPSNTYDSSNYWVDPVYNQTPPVVPAAPTNVTATAGNNGATVSWTPPPGTVTSYTVTPYAGSTAGTPVTVSGSPPASTATVTGLTNGTSYTFTVSATNSLGTGAASAHSNAVTPGPVPGAPTAVTAATAGPGAVTVTWSAPSSSGAITSYTVTPFAGSTAGTPVTVSGSPPATSTTVSGLTNGTTYTFEVSATSSVGTGLPSAPSNPATPESSLNCPCNIFGSQTPPTVDSEDASAVNVGTAFTTDTNGFITGARFYKAAANTGTHVADLWTASGTLLSQATFTGETASGWQQVSFATPVAVTAGTTYVVSYYAPNGRYSVGASGLASQVVAPPLYALASANAPNGNGVFAYGGAPAFPNGTYQATNYYVDPVFSTTTTSPPAAPTGVTAVAGSGSATVSWTAPAGGSVTSYTVTPLAGSTAGTPVTVSGSPPATSTTVSGLTNGTSYTFEVSATNSQGTGPQSAPSNAIIPTAGPAAPTGVTAATAGPGAATVNWTAPAGSVTAYTVTPYVGSTAGTPVTVTGSPPATSTPVSGLTNGTTYTFEVQAINAGGPSPESAPSNLVTPESSLVCPCNVLGTSTPTTVNSGDATAVNVGMAFTTDTNGFITGARFYKAATNTGTHVADLWTASGTLLAQATFTGETASGWQQVSFPSPVAVTAGTTYVVSYLAPNGHYSVTANGFASTVAKPPLYALASAASPNGNGVYVYGEAPAFPTSTYKSSNYFVDAVFAPTVPPAAPTAVTAATAGPGAVTVSWNGWTAGSTGGSQPTSYTVTPFVGSTAGTPVTVTGSPPATSTTFSGLTNGTTYTFEVSATSSAGTGPASAPSNAATPESSLNCPCNIFGSQTPTTVDSGDGSSVNVGTAFTSDTNGFITGARFYKASTNTGTHVADLWTASGTLLSQATFTAETASGWQTVSFSTPVAVTAGTTYVVSYFAPSGHYSVGSSGLASQVNAPPLYALASANAPHGNGVFAYGGAPAFPTSTYNATNYYVDAVFAPTVAAAPPAAPMAVTAATAGPGAVAVSWSQPSSVSAITSYTVTPFAGSTAGTPVTVSGSPPATTTTVSGLTNGTTYTFEVSATSADGTGPVSAPSNPATPEASLNCPCNIFGSQTPTTVDSGDSESVNLGTAFTTDTNGYITGARFYKASTNTGTHLADLWTASGTLLAQATFTNETASGWQTVSFSTPVAVTAGTTYVVSYYAPNGHYSATSNGLTSQVNAPPLYGLSSANAPDGNGVYVYGTGAGFPIDTYNATNYYVDPIFSTTS